MSVGSASTSISIYDILTRMIPGAVFLASIALLVLIPAGEPPSSGTYTVIAFLIGSLVVGEIFNAIRLSLYDVPSHFSRILYTQNEDISHLGRIDRFFAKRSDTIAKDMMEHCIFDNKEADILEIVKNRFDLPDEFQGQYDTYNLIISELAGKETRRTTRLRSVYILTRNLTISLISLFVIVLVFGGYSLINSGFSVNTGLAVAFLIGYFALILLYFVDIVIRELASIDAVYVESLLNDYFTLIYGD